MTNNFCIIPWISIEASPLGNIRACCLSNENIKENNIDVSLKNVSLSEAFNSPYMNNLRKKFIDNEKPASCKRCWDEEESGRISKRQNSYTRLKKFTSQIDFSKIDTGQLMFIDLKLGNICNLKCRICGSFSSSKWAQEEINIYLDNERAKDNLKRGRWPRESQNFWSDLENILENIKYFEFTGGEPFLIDEHFDLLEKAVELGHAKNIEIHYNTNGTTFPQRGLKLWPHFKLVEIALSIDDIGPRFEYQRYGASWNNVIENLNKFYDLRYNCNNIFLQLCITTNVQNFYYIDEICMWINKQKFDSVYFNVLHDAWYFNIANLNKEAKTLIYNKLSPYNGPYSHEIKNLLEFMIRGKNSDCSMLKVMLKNSDEQRNQKFSDHHPEIAAAIGYE
jgi:MoaA/NifB/PqqE/SkfB family radical SAM enzyme